MNKAPKHTRTHTRTHTHHTHARTHATHTHPFSKKDEKTQWYVFFFFLHVVTINDVENGVSRHCKMAAYRLCIWYAHITLMHLCRYAGKVDKRRSLHWRLCCAFLSARLYHVIKLRDMIIFRLGKVGRCQRFSKARNSKAGKAARWFACINVSALIIIWSLISIYKLYRREH
jgi:hypothetical protein